MNVYKEPKKFFERLEHMPNETIKEWLASIPRFRLVLIMADNADIISDRIFTIAVELMDEEDMDSLVRRADVKCLDRLLGIIGKMKVV